MKQENYEHGLFDSNVEEQDVRFVILCTFEHNLLLICTKFLCYCFGSLLTNSQLLFSTLAFS